jgi:hypothetical protein
VADQCRQKASEIGSGNRECTSVVYRFELKPAVWNHIVKESNRGRRPTIGPFAAADTSRFDMFQMTRAIRECSGSSSFREREHSTMELSAATGVRGVTDRAVNLISEPSDSRHWPRHCGAFLTGGGDGNDRQNRAGRRGMTSCHAIGRRTQTDAENNQAE